MTRGVENFKKLNPYMIGKYDIPTLSRDEINLDNIEFIPFNFAKSCKNAKGKSLNDLVEKAKELGWSVKTYNSKQLKQRDDKYKQDRKKADKQLNDIYAKSRGTAKKHRGK